MKYAFFIQIPDEVLEDTVTSTHIISQETIATKRQLLKKSFRLMNPEITAGLMNEDFVHARKTVRVVFKAFKINRIIKNMLFKNKSYLFKTLAP